MGKSASAVTSKSPKDSHFVLYANGYPVHSADSQEECDFEKLNVAQEHRKSGRPSPKFHVVQRDIHENESVSHDTIVSGDEDSPPAGLTKVKGV